MLAVLPAAAHLSNHTPGDRGNAAVEPARWTYKPCVAIPALLVSSSQQKWFEHSPDPQDDLWQSGTEEPLTPWSVNPSWVCNWLGHSRTSSSCPSPDTACSCSTEETATFQAEEMDLKKTTQTIPTLCYFCTLKSEALLRYFKLNPQWPLYPEANICILKKVSFFLAGQLKAIFLLLSSPLKRITFSTADSLSCVVIMVRVIRSDKRNEIFQ